MAVDFDKFLTEQNSPLAGLGSEFTRIGGKYGVDPALLIAIAGSESSFGKYGKGTKFFNAWGWGPHKPFTSWSHGIDTVARGLRKFYLDQGLKTIAAISAKYAPIGATNDPTNLNSNWVKNVSYWYTKLGGKSVALPQGYNVQQTVRVNPDSNVTSVVTPVKPGQKRVTSGPLFQKGVPASPGQTIALKVEPMPSEAIAAYKAMGASPHLIQRLKNANRPVFFKIAPSQIPPAGIWVVREAVEYASKRGAEEIRTATAQAASSSLPSTQEGSFIADAKSQLGKPYVWASSNPRVGFDCSGLLKYLYKKHFNVDLPHYAASQFQMGRSIERGDLLPGDAVFFHQKKDGPGHVGIYIGDDKFLHAPSRGDVVKISTFSTYNGYLGARRYI